MAGVAQGRGGGGLHLSPGKQVNNEILATESVSLPSLSLPRTGTQPLQATGGWRSQRRLELIAVAERRAAGLGMSSAGVISVDSPEAADRCGFTVVSRGGPESEVGAVHRYAKPLAGVSPRVDRRVVADQGVVRVRAGGERGCIAGQGGLAPFGCAALGRGLSDVEGELGEYPALDKVAQQQPFLLAVLDMVLALEGQQEGVEPKQDRDLAGPKAGTCGALVRPLIVRRSKRGEAASSGAQTAGEQQGICSTNSAAPWRRRAAHHSAFQSPLEVH